MITTQEINQILLSLELDPLAKVTPRSKYFYPELISALVNTTHLEDAAVLLSITKDSLYKALSRYVTKIIDKPNAVNWQNFLLSKLGKKRCSKCGIIHITSQFVKCSDNWDGLQIQCKECRAEYRKDFTDTHPDYARNHYLLNTEKYKENAARYRLQVKQATPQWQSRNEILQFYKQCPIGYHVDHIYPIQSDWVCGLHVIDNLQYLSQEENLKKGNRYMSEYHS